MSMPTFRIKQVVTLEIEVEADDLKQAFDKADEIPQSKWEEERGDFEEVDE